MGNGTTALQPINFLTRATGYRPSSDYWFFFFFFFFFFFLMHIINFSKGITGYKLAKSIGDFLESRRAEEIMCGVFHEAEGNTASLSPRARTARGWLHMMGANFRDFRKDVYVDGHEREDVQRYRREEFIPKWLELRKRLCQFDPDHEASPWRIPTGLGDEKPTILVTHDESTFNANDGRKRGWIVEDKFPLLPKSRGKGIMVSAFLTPGGILAVPDSVSDGEILARHPDWQKNEDGSLVREAVRYFEYGKDRYWTADHVVEHTLHAMRIFRVAFPDYQGTFAFDNATNHSSFAEDALVASKMKLGPGGAQPKVRDGWYVKNGRRRPQRMIFGVHHENRDLRNAPKGIRRVLEERGLWRTTTHFENFHLQCKDCPTSGLDYKQCCARTLLANQPDFLEQKGRLEETIVGQGMEILFYPKFHCELNFIERFWSSVKKYARDHCTYSFDGLKKTIPAAVHSVSNATINNYFDHCDRIVDAYALGLEYGTMEFTQRVYTTHRQVQDKSKW